MTTPRKLTADERGESYGLSALQVRAAELTVAGDGPLKIAKAVGVARRTLTRWKAIPAMQRLCDELRAETVERARAVLAGSAESAARVIVGIATGPARKGTGYRLAAAKDILDRILGCPAKTEIHVAQNQGQALTLPDDFLDRLDRTDDTIDAESVVEVSDQ